MDGLPALRSTAVFLLLASTTLAARPSGSPREFEELRDKAMKAERAGSWHEAKQAWEKANAIATEAFQPLESLTRLAAKDGSLDDAFRWLGRAYDGCFTDPILGFFSPAYLSDNENYSPLHSDSRWEPWLATVTRQCDEGVRSRKDRQVDLDWHDARPFKSYRKLASEFDRQRKGFEDERWRMSFAQIHAATSAIREQRIAALHRYIHEHPAAKDRADAAWDVIVTRIWPRIVERKDPWGAFGAQVLEELDAFTRDYPGSSHSGQAAFDRTFVAFAGGTEGGADLLALDRALAEVSAKYSGTPPGGLALAWRLIGARDPSSGIGATEMGAMRAELDRLYRHDRKVQELLWTYGGATQVLTSGVSDFDGADMAGTRWTASSFSGRVVLIDFWATWCAPCVAELPWVRKAWSAYRDAGLVVLGVSLDFDDRAQFARWIAANDVTWPQIWDGKGFSTALARKYSVHLIPFTVLVGRDGRVTDVDLRGEALLARIKAMIESPEVDARDGRSR